MKKLLITIIILGLLVGTGFILDATIPAVHDFFVSAIDWIKDLFITNSESIEENATSTLNIMR